jgi:hypothetical protein
MATPDSVKLCRVVGKDGMMRAVNLHLGECFKAYHLARFANVKVESTRVKTKRTKRRATM